MANNPFIEGRPNIADNESLRKPQVMAFQTLAEVSQSSDPTDQEVGVILPVGCGKSGCISIAPFAYKSKRTLIVAPNVTIANQLFEVFDPTSDKMFYKVHKILLGPPYPEPTIIRGRETNKGDLEVAQVVVTNAQQLQGQNNRWLSNLETDFFDLILFDEGHHNVAETWDSIKRHFPNARIVNFSATPKRADGQLMAGRIVYTYSVFDAIQAGYVKQLKAVVLSPSTLRYVRKIDNQEVEVDLDEVRRLGADDSDFRRSIVTSTETLSTIVDASIMEMNNLRDVSQDNRIKIIASALNYAHCIDIVKAYRERNVRADFLHSTESKDANAKVYKLIEQNELDVVVQVKMLGEGFDHPYFGVAAVFSIFANLSPFVQFVGRIMRCIVQEDPEHPLNNGSVVFHAGANVAERWDDFRVFSEADQKFFKEMLPSTELHFSKDRPICILPVYSPHTSSDEFEITSQTDVTLQDIPLSEKKLALAEAVQLLHEAGYSSGDLDEMNEELRMLERQPVTLTRKRQATRKALDDRIRIEAGRVLKERGINPFAATLNRGRGKINFVVVKSRIDVLVNQLVGRSQNDRSEFTQSELDTIFGRLNDIVERVVSELFDIQN